MSEFILEDPGEGRVYPCEFHPNFWTTESMMRGRLLTRGWITCDGPSPDALPSERKKPFYIMLSAELWDGMGPLRIPFKVTRREDVSSYEGNLYCTHNDGVMVELTAMLALRDSGWSLTSPSLLNDFAPSQF